MTNTGSAFGLMRGWFNFHLVFGTIMAVVMFVLLFRRSTDRLTRFASALILSGIFGNVTDRMIHGHVIDFLDFYLGRHHWPAFQHCRLRDRHRRRAIFLGLVPRRKTKARLRPDSVPAQGRSGGRLRNRPQNYWQNPTKGYDSCPTPGPAVSLQVAERPD